MAHDWFVKRGEKTFGPFTSAQLKKLAGEGKVAPSTEIRLGDAGAWTIASRVKGLFATPQDSSGSASLSASSLTSAAIPPVPPPVAKSESAPPPVARPIVSAPLTATPQAAAPPIARPLAAAPLAAGVPQVKPAAHHPPIAGKLIGAVGLTFGVLALGTCWLALLNTMFGWVGITVGALGLVIGIAGLVVAALQNASGLVLNVAAACSALIGLVVSVVLGINTGLFSKPVAPVAAPLPVLVQAPPQPAPQVNEPEPAPEPEFTPPPELVWTDASQSIEQGPIRARITAAAIEQVRLESANPLSMKREKPAPHLHVRVMLENISTDKIVPALGWMGGGASSGALGAVGQVLGDSELGKHLTAATAGALLIDDQGNGYPQIEAIRLSTAQAELGRNPSLRPGESSEKHLLFEPPLEAAAYLRIELAPGGFGGNEPLRFQIPKSMWAGDAAAAPAEPAPAAATAPASDAPAPGDAPSN